MEGIKAASVYAEADFRINQSAFRSFDRFEKKIDKLKKKLEGISSPNITVGGKVASGGGRSSGGSGGGRGGDGWYWNTIGKVAYNMRKREAMVESAVAGMHNTFRTLKIPQKDMDRLTNSVKTYGEQLKNGTMISAEFAVHLKKIKSEARDLHKQLNVPPPKYSKDINKGSVNQLANIAKAQSKQDMSIFRARAAFDRATTELNIKEGSKAWKQHHAILQSAIQEYKDAPWAVNKFKESITGLDIQMRKAGKQGFAGMTAGLRGLRAGLIGLAAVVGGQLAMSAEQVGVQFNNMNIMLETSFGGNAKKELAFVRREADALGVSLLDTARAWTKIGMSADVGGFSLDEARGLFTSLLGFSKAMGLTAEQTSLSFLALTQAYSKNALTAEELNSQLADHIPGIVALTQNALGYKGSGDAFSKALKNKEFTPEKFAKALAEVFTEKAGKFKESENFGYEQKKGQLANAWKEALNAIFLDMEPRLMLLYDNLGYFLKEVTPVFTTVLSSIAWMLAAVTLTLRLIYAAVHDAVLYMAGDENVRKEINDYFGIKSSAGSKIDSMFSNMNPMYGPSGVARAAIIEVGKYLVGELTDALKGITQIEIIPSEDYKVKVKQNNPWPAFSTATTE